MLRLSENEKNRYLAMWEFAQGARIVLSTPPQIQVARSNRCNFKCVYCYDHHEGNEVPKGSMDEQVWAGLEPLIDRASQATFHGVSEFMLDPKFFEIVERCARAGTTLMLNTNGSVCTEKHLDALASYPGKVLMTFSLDAASTATFLRIRGKDFDRIIANIRRYVSALGGKKGNYLGLTFVVLKSNVHEMEDFVRLAKTLGVKGVRFHRLLEYQTMSWRIPAAGGTFDYREELPAHYQEEFNRALERCGALGRELGILVELPAPIAKEPA